MRSRPTAEAKGGMTSFWFPVVAPRTDLVISCIFLPGGLHLESGCGGLGEDQASLSALAISD